MKKKLQVKSKNIPKWIPPEKRMKKYPKNVKDTSKIPFTKFLIVVPTEEDKQELQAAFEFIHDGPILDNNDSIVLNQLAHSYLDGTLEKGHPEVIIVDEDTFRSLEQEVCPHTDTYNDGGINYCKKCWKALEVTSWRD